MRPSLLRRSLPASAKVAAGENDEDDEDDEEEGGEDGEDGEDGSYAALSQSFGPGEAWI